MGSISTDAALQIAEIAGVCLGVLGSFLVFFGACWGAGKIQRFFGR